MFLLSSDSENCLLLLFLSVFSFDTAGGVGDSAQTFFRNQLTCLAADAVGLVLDTDKGVLQMLDELFLTLCELAGFIF